jgi:hypothetical protein
MRRAAQQWPAAQQGGTVAAMITTKAKKESTAASGKEGGQQGPQANRVSRRARLITNDEGLDGVRRVARSGLADGFILMDVELDDARMAVLREAGTRATLIGLPATLAGWSAWTTTSPRPAPSAPTTWRSWATASSPSSATRRLSTSGTPATRSAP